MRSDLINVIGLFSMLSTKRSNSSSFSLTVLKQCGYLFNISFILLYFKTIIPLSYTLLLLEYDTSHKMVHIMKTKFSHTRNFCTIAYILKIVHCSRGSCFVSLGDKAHTDNTLLNLYIFRTEVSISRVAH